MEYSENKIFNEASNLTEVMLDDKVKVLETSEHTKKESNELSTDDTMMEKIQVLDNSANGNNHVSGDPEHLDHVCEQSGTELGDSSLPKGWRRERVQRTKGRKNGKYDCYVITDTGKKLRSQLEIESYIENNLLSCKTTLKGDVDILKKDETNDDNSIINDHEKIVGSNHEKIIGSNHEKIVEGSTNSKGRTKRKNTASKNSAVSILCEQELVNTVEYNDEDANSNIEMKLAGEIEDEFLESENINSNSADENSELAKASNLALINPTEVDTAEPPVKRGRGRPPGALNKKNRKKRGKENKPIIENVDKTDKQVEEDLKLTQDEINYIEEVNNFLTETSLGLEPCPPTKGDGNCWYRAAAEQVALHQIPDQPTEHAALRLAVCNYVKHLPSQVKEDTINVVYFGKSRGLKDLASRQRKLGQWVDNTGVMVMTTAHLLSRNIRLYGYGPGGGEGPGKQFSVTTIEGGEGAESHPPLTIFYHDKHYQTLRPVVDHQAQTDQQISN